MLLSEGLGIRDEYLEEIRRRPSVHVLCTGAMLLERMEISDDIVCIPCAPIGNQTKATILAKYALEILKIPFDQHGFDHAFAAGLMNDPMTVIVIKNRYNGTLDEINQKIEGKLKLSLNIVSSILGKPLFPFYELFVSENKTSQFRMVPQIGHRSQTRTGIFRYEMENSDLARRLFSAAQKEDRLSFILSLLHDLIRENNPEFQIARVFNVLEAIAWEQKRELRTVSTWSSFQSWLFSIVGRRVSGQDSQVGSRAAVRRLLNMEGNKSLREFKYKSVSYKFDPIEFSGHIRDKLYHGARIRRSKLPTKVRPGLDLMQNNPHMIVDVLMDFAKTAVYSWINEILEETDTGAPKRTDQSAT